MIYIMPYDIYLCTKNTSNFIHIYGNSYNSYIIHQVNPSLILKDMLLYLDKPEDIYETLTYFEIQYTHNYLEFILDHLTKKSEKECKMINYNKDNIQLDIEVKKLI